MVRNILTVGIGVVLSFLASAAAAMLFYRLSDRWSEAEFGAFARYAISPVIGILVGVCVGFLAKSRPGFMAALSHLPWVLGSYFSRALSVSHYLVLMFGDAVCILLSVSLAVALFRTRSRPSCNYGLIDGCD
jgi:uncharacterized membrane protein